MADDLSYILLCSCSLNNPKKVRYELKNAQILESADFGKTQIEKLPIASTISNFQEIFLNKTKVLLFSKVIFLKEIYHKKKTRKR